MAQFDESMGKIREICERNPMLDNLLTTASSTAGLKKEYMALCGIALPFLLLLMMGGAHFIVDLVAYLYPAYASVRAIESDGTEDDTQWLTYWLVFSLFKLVEGVADSILQYIPFYFVAKITFLVWCFYPGIDGAKVVYEYAIKPHVAPIVGAGTNKKKDE
jgi:receptor expression-enhancing protein 5/6